MDRLSDLPEPVLHRILYFLSNKEAARTCVLSKSWRHIWSNRHELCLSDKGNKKDFIFQANNTLQSLLDQNHQGIHKFHLTISTLNSQTVSFLLKWVPLLTAMSIKHVYLHILPPNNNNNNNQEQQGVEFDLPFEAFAAKSLRNLILHRCNLLSLSPQHHNKQLVNIPFKHTLQILRLRNVSVNEQDNIVNKIVSSCTCLTSMLFEQCQGLRNLKITNNNHKNLRHFTFIAHESYRKRDCNIRIIDLPTIETIKTVGSKVLLRNREYCELKSLHLEKVRISRDSFDKSSSCNFPKLEDLRFIACSGGLITCIDAPNIVRFEYLGSQIPSLSFTPTCRKWRSYISLQDLGHVQSWFLNLSQLLHSLTQSEITLRILNVEIPEDPPLALVEEDIDNIKHVVPAVVESLELGGNVPCFPALLDGLFCICRPRYIAQYLYFASNELMRMEQKELIEFLCTINQRQGEIRHLPSDVKLQSFDRGRRQWKFTDQNSLASINSQAFGPIRFLLNWSQDC